MVKRRADDGLHFLTVDEAAEVLGQSRLRVREAVARGLLESRRDNEGRLRVDIPDAPRLISEVGAPAKADLAPDAVVSFLFDEVEELEATLSAKDVQIARLSGLVEGQGAALEQAEAALTASEGSAGRLAEVLDRALAHLEDDTIVIGRLQDVSGRALDHLEHVSAELDQSLAQTARFEELLARAVALAETREDGRLGEAADRAFALLEDAVACAEAAQAAEAKGADMLGRALEAGERMQVEIKAREARIAEQQETIETTLSMSERAVAVAALAAKQPQKKGFLRRLLGI
ncbi:hypothetical protein CFI11_12345 [Thalassococcus sp. S3]|nr:hypothetical protein CFI11_12345 [Thalassococcus sp. S3]